MRTLDLSVTVADRTRMVGVLANLTAAFEIGLRQEEEAGHLLRHMMERFRRELSADLGREATDDDCAEELTQQGLRLRHSIGERW